MSLRVVHQARVPVADRADCERLEAYVATARDRDGCLEAEHYRSLDDDDQMALTELWEGQEAFSRHWGEVVAAGVPRWWVAPIESGGAATTELYPQQTYARSDGVWTPVDVAEEGWRVQWPARGAVRAGIASSGRPTPQAPWPGGRGALEETRREPGCLQFEVFVGVEHPQDGLLLELWQDQARYDDHWRLRTSARSTGAVAAGGGQVAEDRGHGTNTLEFYRQQQFVHLYDRWLPADHSAWSATVAWSP